MKQKFQRLAGWIYARAQKSRLWFAVKCSGVLALAWFLIRVVPKPSRASYPCQRAAFPVASGFVIWLCGAFALKSGMAQADQPPLGTVYKQGDHVVASVGVHEHWDGEATRPYSRNLDPVNGKGIEFIYLPPGDTKVPSAPAANAGNPTNMPPQATAVLPGQGLSQHPFVYTGEWDYRGNRDRTIFKLL